MVGFVWLWFSLKEILLLLVKMEVVLENFVAWTRLGGEMESGERQERFFFFFYLGA